LESHKDNFNSLADNQQAESMAIAMEVLGNVEEVLFDVRLG
jgi:hypothetical protein